MASGSFTYKNCSHHLFLIFEDVAVTSKATRIIMSSVTRAGLDLFPIWTVLNHCCDAFTRDTPTILRTAIPILTHANGSHRYIEGLVQ